MLLPIPSSSSSSSSAATTKRIISRSNGRRVSWLLTLLFIALTWSFAFILFHLPDPPPPNHLFMRMSQHPPSSTASAASEQQGQGQAQLIRKYDIHQASVVGQKRFIPLDLFESSTGSRRNNNKDDDLPSNVALKSIMDQIKNRNGSKHVTSCSWWRTNTKGNLRLVYNDLCDEATNLVVYNPLEHESRHVQCYEPNNEKKSRQRRNEGLQQQQQPLKRTIQIPPRDFVVIPKDCFDVTSMTTPPVHLFPVEATLPSGMVRDRPKRLDGEGGDETTQQHSLFHFSLAQPQQSIIPPVPPVPPILISAEGVDNGSGVIRHKSAANRGIRTFGNCDVPCQRKDYEGLNTIKTVEGKWSFTYSMESTGYYPSLAVKSRAHRLDQYYATTSFQSEVPLPYFSWAEYDIGVPSAVSFATAIKGASFIARNCDSNNHREDMVKELSKYFRVDSLSSCLHNADPPNGLDLSDKKKLQQQYLFHLAFENTNEDDYITEKLWGTLESGTVPVYYGAPNVKEHAPPNSIISWHDFGNNTEALANYLKELAENQTLYESYHAWRRRRRSLNHNATTSSSSSLPVEFERKYNFTHTHSICRMCRWGYAKKYGWGWNHEEQTVSNIRLGPRRPCFDATTSPTPLMIHPVTERWFSHLEVLKAPQRTMMMMEAACKKDSLSTTTMEVGTWKRTVSYHDGIIDMFIHGTGESGGILQLEFPTPTTADGGGAKLQEMDVGHIQWQTNATSRITVLLDWAVPLKDMVASSSSSSSSSSSVHALNIPVDRPGLMRIRIISEDVDTFHKGGSEEHSYFATLMKKDFLHPVEFFLIDENSE